MVELQSMKKVNISQAKSSLSKLIEVIEQGHEKEIIIARANRPVAKLVLLEQRATKRIGVAKSKFEILDTGNMIDPVAKLFLEGDSEPAS